MFWAVLGAEWRPCWSGPPPLRRRFAGGGRWRSSRGPRACSWGPAAANRLRPKGCRAPPRHSASAAEPRNPAGALHGQSRHRPGLAPPRLATDPAQRRVLTESSLQVEGPKRGRIFASGDCGPDPNGHPRPAQRGVGRCAPPPVLATNLRRRLAARLHALCAAGVPSGRSLRLLRRAALGKYAGTQDRVKPRGLSRSGALARGPEAGWLWRCENHTSISAS